jgi:HD-like signal output (HDOD) protein
LRILFAAGKTGLPPELVDHIADLGQEWSLVHTNSGNEAITEIAASAFDAVIAAPDLHDMSCAAVLGQIRTLRPETIRIALLDSYSNQDVPSSHLLSLAHRFLPLWPAPEILIETLYSLEEFRDLLMSPRIGSTIGRIEKLPSPPHLYLKLMHALEEDGDSDAANIAKLISTDPIIAAKVLQLCNSAFFPGRNISDLRSAVTRLGISTLRQLVLACEVFSTPSLSLSQRSAIQQRALTSSRLAAKLLPASSADLGATAALLADIGLLLPDVRDQRQPPTEDDLRPGHAEAGAYLLGLWGFAMPVVEAVALQLQPQSSSTHSFWICGAVHVATALASGEAVNEDYLAKVGVLKQLPAWRAQAEMLMNIAEEA